VVFNPMLYQRSPVVIQHFLLHNPMTTDNVPSLQVTPTSYILVMNVILLQTQSLRTLSSSLVARWRGPLHGVFFMPLSACAPTTLRECTFFASFQMRLLFPEPWCPTL